MSSLGLFLWVGSPSVNKHSRMGHINNRGRFSSDPPPGILPEAELSATQFLQDCEAWWKWLERAEPSAIEARPVDGHRGSRPRLLLPVGVSLPGLASAEVMEGLSTLLPKPRGQGLPERPETSP